jgi:hypothetical protein
MSKSIPENPGTVAIDAGILDGLKSASVSIMDGMLTAVLSGSLMENIPGFGLVFAGAKTYSALKERAFASKLQRFLLALNKVTLVEQQEFTARINGDPEFKQKIGENLLLLLDKLDDVEKASLVGRFFMFYVQGIINYDHYRRYVLTIDRAHLPDLESLIRLSSVQEISLLELDRTQMGALQSLGICYAPTGVQLEPTHRDYDRLGDDKSTTTVWLTEMGISFRDLMRRTT